MAWGTSDKDGMENIVTGAVDDMVKCWRWFVFCYYFIFERLIILYCHMSTVVLTPEMRSFSVSACMLVTVSK